MPSLKSAHMMGRAVMAGLLGLCATGALAASDPELLVSQHPNQDRRAVEVRVSDHNLDSPYAQRTLALRVKRAAREVCDIYPGSTLDQLPTAQTCFNDARTAALAQLEARGVPAARLTAAGGMR